MRTLALSVLLAGCVAQISEPAGSSPPVTPVAPPAAIGNGWPAFEPSTSYQLRRLTNAQYLATVQTLLGVSADGMPPIEPVSPVDGFDSIGAASVVVSSDGVADFEGAARFLADAAFTSTAARAALVPCTPSGLTDTACFQAFATSFGQRAFRRPLTSDEVTAYVALTASVAMATQDAWQALEATTTAFLQSPDFLYLPEVGEPDPSQPERYRYTDYEMASRLSYFLTNDTPDDELLAAAAAGMLTTPDGVQTQTRRLLGLPSARDAVRNFFSAMLALDGLDTLTRPVEIFPAFTPTIGAAFKEQTLRTFEDLVFDSDGDYREVFNEPATFVNTELAGFYGLPAPSGSDFERVTYPAGAVRSGLLGQAGVLIVHDTSGGTSPTKRGLFVLTRLLCQPLALAPPANLTIPPPPTGLLTARQRLSQHASNPVCASCHTSMDSVGLSLDNFDAIGTYRTTEYGMTIDDSGELTGSAYHGEVELGALLHDHPALEPCLVQAIYQSSVGHLAEEFDRATFTSLINQFAAGGARIQGLLGAITASDGFRYLPPPN